jgi:hypothetical protein
MTMLWGLVAGVLAGLRAAGVCGLAGAADRAHDGLDREPEDDEISDHLPGDHEPAPGRSWALMPAPLHWLITVSELLPVSSG